MIKLSQKELKQLLSSVSFAMPKNEIRENLNSTLLSFESDYLIAAATDGQCLAINKVLVDSNSQDEIKFVLPRKSVIALSKFLNNSIFDLVTIEITSEKIEFIFDEFTFSIRKIYDSFPDIKRVLRKFEYSEIVPVDSLNAIDSKYMKNILSQAQSDCVLSSYSKEKDLIKISCANFCAVVFIGNYIHN